MDIAHRGMMGGEDIGPLSIEAHGYNPNQGKDGYPDDFLPFPGRAYVMQVVLRVMR